MASSWIARSTDGSPKRVAKPTASSPARTPASIPRRSRFPTMGILCSVAGEAEKMPAVMHIFMHVMAGEHRCGALLRADEIDHEQEKDAAKQRPRQNFAKGNVCRKRPAWDESNIAHHSLLGILRPLCVLTGKEGLACGIPGRRAAYSGATAADLHRLLHIPRSVTVGVHGNCVNDRAMAVHCRSEEIQAI